MIPDSWKPTLVFQLALANAVGFSSISTSAPFWISGVGARYGLPLWSGAVIATFQLACAALTNIATPWLFRKKPAKLIGLYAAAVAIVGNLVALAPNPVLFVLGCGLTGAALGVVLNIANRLAAEMKSAERAYAIFEIVGVLFSMAVFLVVPMLVTRFGSQIVFVVLALLSLIALLNFVNADFTADLFIKQSLQNNSDIRAIRSDGPSVVTATVIALLAMSLLFIGESSVNAFFVPLGKALSIDITKVGRIMAGGLVASLLGGGLARVLADRLGIVAPTIGGTLVLAADVVILTDTHSAFVFTVATVMYFVCIVFITPYAFALLADIDKTGRAASIGPAFLMIGVSIGPSVGASSVAFIGMWAIGWCACASVLSATVLFMVAAFRRQRGLPGQAGI